MAPDRTVSRAGNKGQPGAAALTKEGKGLTTGAERVWFIVEMMSTGLWLKRVSNRFLQELWGVSESRVKQLSQSASNIVLDPKHREELDALRERYKTIYERWAAEEYARGSRKEAREHLKISAQLLGLFEAQKHEVKFRYNLEKSTDIMLGALEDVLGPEKAKEVMEKILAKTSGQESA